MNNGKNAPENFDVIVVGGGPGGSTVASFVAMEGTRCSCSNMRIPGTRLGNPFFQRLSMEFA